MSGAGLVATFVLPKGRSLFQRLPSLVVRLVHWAFVQASRLCPKFHQKEALLSAVGPVALVVQLGVFLALFLVGFALAIWPWSQSFGLAVRESAAGLFTVGLAHVNGPTNDVLVVLAAASGAITVALQIGYLPIIYQSYARREALVALMESRAGVPSWGPEVLMRHQLIASVDALGGFYKDWELWSAELAESHGTHPVLILFRSALPGHFWLLSLLAVLDAAAMQLALNPTDAPKEARFCLRMGFSALRRLALTQGWKVERDPSPDGPIDVDLETFATAVRELERIGFVTERDAEEAYAHFRGWRVNYESTVYRFADFLLAPHAPWSGARHHLPADIVPPERPPHRSPGGGSLEESTFRRRVAGAP
jgi:hypothetical protein